MERTPDEIKKGLVEAIEECAWVVEGGDAHDLLDACEMAHASMADALVLIQQLQAENAEKDVRIQQLEKRVIHLEALNQSNLTTITMQERTRARLQERISQLEAERDAAVGRLKQIRDCERCKNYPIPMQNIPCLTCTQSNNSFEWRGVQKEE